MFKPSHLLAACLTLALGACAQAPVMTASGAGTAVKSVTVRGNVQQADVTKALRTLQDVSYAVPFELKRTVYFEVWLRDRNIANSTAAKIGRLDYHGDSDLSTDHTFDPVVIQNLAPNHTFEVTLKAFQIDVAGFGLHSAPQEVEKPEESVTVISTNSSDVPNAQVTDGAASIDNVSFNVAYKDQEFHGQATGGIVNKDGVLTPPDIYHPVGIDHQNNTDIQWHFSGDTPGMLYLVPYDTAGNTEAHDMLIDLNGLDSVSHFYADPGTYHVYSTYDDSGYEGLLTLTSDHLNPAKNFVTFNGNDDFHTSLHDVTSVVDQNDHND